MMNTSLFRWLALLVGLSSVAGAQGQSLFKDCIGSGFMRAQTQTYFMTGTFGQSSTGLISNFSDSGHIGFWLPAEPAGTFHAPLPPQTFSVISVAPNPFSSETTVRFSLPEKCDVALTVWNEDGDVARHIQRAQCPAGVNTIQVARGSLPSGSYTYALTDGHSTLTGTMNIVR